MLRVASTRPPRSPAGRARDSENQIADMRGVIILSLLSQSCFAETTTAAQPLTGLHGLQGVSHSSAVPSRTRICRAPGAGDNRPT
jgi:hypothetical protein